MLKLAEVPGELHEQAAAAFGRLCVETASACSLATPSLQPPSGGCVLKQASAKPRCRWLQAAAFGRLCVETGFSPCRLRRMLAAAFGRLCVETRAQYCGGNIEGGSRLRAAVC